jgi:hypothetical protein
MPGVGKNVGSHEWQEANGNRQQHEKIREHNHLEVEVLFCSQARQPSRAGTT